MKHRDEVNVGESNYLLYYFVITQGFKLLPILWKSWFVLSLVRWSWYHLCKISLWTKNPQIWTHNSWEKIKICLAKPWDRHFQRHYGLWGLRNHVQFSMKTISYFLLHFSLPAWRRWLKSSWHILFLMSSQAQNNPGKVICQNVCHPPFFYFPHHIFASLCMFFCLSRSSLFLHFSTLQSHRVIRYASSFFKMMWALRWSR